MKRAIKALLFIPAVLFELLFLAVCWLVALCHKPTGKRLVLWSIDNLPAKEWYLGEKKAHNPPIDRRE